MLHDSTNNMQNSSQYSDNISISSTNSNNINQQIRSRINSFKISMFTTPKFYRRKIMSKILSPFSRSGSAHRDPKRLIPVLCLSLLAPEKGGESPNLDSKSWFQRWNFRQENINNPSQNEQEKEKEFVFVLNDRPLNSVKADLIHAFLSVSGCAKYFGANLNVYVFG